MVVTRRYSARVSGSTWKPQRCERCQTQFAYQVTREFTGEGVSPYMLDNAGAQERARTAAHKGLAHSLANAREDVPCPKCLSYNADAVTRLKKAKYGWMLGLGILGLVGTMMISPIVVADEIPQLPAIAFVLSGLGVGVALLVLRSKNMSNFDPNSDDLRTERQATLSKKKTILREQYEALMESARAAGRADELVQIAWV